MYFRTFTLVSAVALLLGCAGDPGSRTVVDEAITAMGGLDKLQAVESIVRRGAGSRTMIGQVRTADEAPTAATLTNYTEALEFGGGRAMVEYDLAFGAFEQHRVEAITKQGRGIDAAPVGYQMINDRGSVVSTDALLSYSAFDTPAMALQRDIVNVMIDANEETRTSTRIAVALDFEGTPSRRVEIEFKGQNVQLFFNPETKLLAGFEAMETDPFLGDVPVQYVFGDYREVDGLLVPYEMKIVKDGDEVANMRYDSIGLNEKLPGSDYAIPEEMEEEAVTASERESVPIELNRLSRGVYQVVGFSHNSMVVEFPNYLVVVEAPLNEVQTIAMIRAVREEFPLKPIQYAIVTHPHPDHVGGLRRLASIGTTLLVEQRHEDAIRKLIDARHGYTPDSLHTMANTPGRRGDIGGIETFSGQHELKDGNRTIQLFALEDSAHVTPMVVAYLPGERILFQSDLYTPGSPTATPESTGLFEAIESLEIRVDTIVGGHGATADFSELAEMSQGS
jgi:glyoxylase-like metal-dependent hydrolase (beta-lactamase superfamily II)